MKRTFIAFDIIPSEETKEIYDLIRHKLRLEKINWISASQFHMTIQFLGDTKEEMIPSISAALDKIVTGYNSFEVVLQGIGIFRNLHDPRVIWLGVKADPLLEHMKNDICRELQNFGIETDNRRFSPHLTLGRIKQMRQINALSELLVQYNNARFQTSRIREVIFYESRLNPAGSVYTPISLFTLK